MTVEWRDNMNVNFVNATFTVEIQVLGSTRGFHHDTNKFNLTVGHNVEYTVLVTVMIQCSERSRSVLRFSVGE